MKHRRSIHVVRVRNRRMPMLRSFTLTELLVAMGIIAVISAITAISIRTVARDAKMSSATNTLIAALDTARSIAIRENTYVVVVLRARLDGQNNQYVELVTARWVDEGVLMVSGSFGGGPTIVDRFVPVPGIASRRLPSGIKVAGPLYHSSNNTERDDFWATQTHLPRRGVEEPNRILGVMYDHGGRVVSRNSTSNAFRMWVDYNNDGLQQISGCDCPNSTVNYRVNPPQSIPSGPPNHVFNARMMMQDEPDDESLVTLVPFLAVYDDVEFRDRYDPNLWGIGEWEQMGDDLSEYIQENAERIHFNRYTGVVMR